MFSHARLTRLAAPHAADADGGDVQQIARRGEAVPEHMAWDDGEPAPSRSDLRDEPPSRDQGPFVVSADWLLVAVVWLFELADADVAERQRAFVIALQRDVPRLAVP